MNDINDPLAIARSLGVYEDAAPRRWWKIPRTLEFNTEVVILGAYTLVTFGVYIGLLIHP